MKIKEKVKSFFNNIISAYRFLLIIIILCGFIVYFGFLFYHIGTINAAQLGFAGSIIGGAITLLGVYGTVQYEKDARKKEQERHDKERKEELAALYKPFISLKSSFCLLNNKSARKNISPINYTETKLEYESYFNTSYVIKNTGQGEAKNVNIEFEYKLNNGPWEKPKGFLSTFSYSLLPLNEKETRSITFYIEKIIFNNFAITTTMPLHCRYIVTYCDFNNYKHYKIVYDIANELEVKPNKKLYIKTKSINLDSFEEITN